MLVQRISSCADLEQLGDYWNCLSRGVPFRSWQWLYAWWRHYGDDCEPFILSVRDAAGRLVGLAPFRLNSSAARGRVVRFLGSGEVCSDYLTVLSTQEHEDAVAAAVAQWLICASAGRACDGSEDNRWDLLELTGVDAEDRAVPKLAKHLEAGGCPLHLRAGPSCWRIDLPETWEEYLGALSKSHRHQVRRAERRVLNSGRVALRTARSADELTRGMEILVDLHQKRWRSQGRPGSFAIPRFSEFLYEAAERLLAIDRLRLDWLELEGRPAAAELQLVGGDVTYAYQSGVDPEALHESPGWLLQIASVRSAIEEKQRWLDLLRGDEPYKMHWRARPRPSVELRVAAKRPGAQLRHGAWVVGGAVKHWIKCSLNLHGAR
jgi:CelD/BcsL family acetyltransferase involved in cellulose biosynthesis